MQRDELLAEHLPISFSNPNYQLDDMLSTEDSQVDGDPVENYDDSEIYEDIDTGTFTRNSSVKSRRSYNHIDLPAMGLDLTSDPVKNLPSTPQLSSPESLTANERLDNEAQKQADEFLNNYKRLDDSNKNDEIGKVNSFGLIEGTVIENNFKNINSDSSVNRNGVTEKNELQYVHGPRNEDIYAVVNKKAKSTNKESERADSPKEQDSTDSQEEKQQKEEKLPNGWEKHEDADGPYYWHIKSGTIQREAPPPQVDAQSVGKESASTDTTGELLIKTAESNAEIPISQLADESNASAHENNVTDKSGTDAGECKQIRFAVQSLGWVEISEDDLTPERSSKAVSRCIVDLSMGRNVLLDVVGRWGDGKELYMDLDDHNLKLIDPQDMAVLNNQPIHSIRVWGVGRDNGRDFAYVARDKVTRKHMCHVFRCDSPARTIANTLRDICKKIMIERSLAHNLAQSVSTAGIQRRARPTNLPTQNRRGVRPGSAPVQSFPTPMEEPKKTIKAYYLGATQVNKPMGIDIVNTAIERMIHMSPRDMWSSVSVAVAPSVITISDYTNPEKILHESRVRYLSFLGIGRDVEYCAYIMHTAQDLYMAHVFYCEPSSGALAKTIEAACKLRYQKCLDAHAKDQEEQTPPTTPKSIGMAIKGMLGSLAGRKKSSNS